MSSSEPVRTKINRIIFARGMPAAEAERVYGLTPGIIRVWIFRGIRLRHSEYTKIGREWWVLPSAIQRIIKEYGVGE